MGNIRLAGPAREGIWTGPQTVSSELYLLATVTGRYALTELSVRA